VIIHRLEHAQSVPTPLEACWEFFSNPHNLPAITPPELGMRVVGSPGESVYPGMMLEFRVRPLFGIPLPWLSEITHVVTMAAFCDEQRLGPYALWHHEHFFEPVTESETRIRDRVHYRLPLSPLSEPMHSLLVAPRLKRIFDFRREAVTRHFGSCG
jgi:ligand-binding SRPBCC domain-containing protein